MFKGLKLAKLAEEIGVYSEELGYFVQNRETVKVEYKPFSSLKIKDSSTR
ncbi:TPA: hypothetical protein ACPJ1J_001453 [Vibrio alginolyticus]